MKQIYYKGQRYTYDDYSCVYDALEEVRKDGFDEKDIIRRAQDEVNRRSTDSDKEYGRKLIRTILDERDFIVFANSVTTRIVTRWDPVVPGQILKDKTLYDLSSLKEGIGLLFGGTFVIGMIFVVISSIFMPPSDGPMFVLGSFIVALMLSVWLFYTSTRDDIINRIHEAYTTGVNATRRDIDNYDSAANHIAHRYDKKSKQ